MVPGDSCPPQVTSSQPPSTSPVSSSSSASGGRGIRPEPDRLLVPGTEPQILQSGRDGESTGQDAVGGRPRLFKLPRKIPSQEFFSVAFDILNEQGYEILPASREITLGEAMQCLLDRRGLQVSAIDVFTDNSNTPLNLTIETYRLGGNNLHVRAKASRPPSRAKFSRANSTDCCSGSSGYPQTPPPFQRSPLANSPKSGLDERKDKKGSTRGRRAVNIPSDFLGCDPSGYLLQQNQDNWWGANRALRTAAANSKKPGIFTSVSKNDKDKMELLTELLNQYSQQGIPELPGLLSFGAAVDPQSDPLHLEDHWSRFVDNVQSLTKRTQNQQDAIWELLETEVFYIRRLKIITDLFIACLCNLQNECILNEIDTEQMFSNLSEVSLSNQQFWLDHLLPMLQSSRATGEPLNPILMRKGFLMFDQIYHPYIKYCSDHSVCLKYVKEKHKLNDLFKTYVAWCETQKDCERLRLTDLLVKPMQRLTKYSLLLKAILKKTDDEDQKQALTNMNHYVEKFVWDVDAILRRKHEQERLSSIIDRIESYHVIETSNEELQKALREHSNLDLTCPMPQCSQTRNRELLLEGSGLKLKDAASNKVDVHCFLFTDMLLICKPLSKKGDRVRVIRQPYVVDRLVVQETKEGNGLLVVYLNEYKVAVAAFVLQSAESKIWCEAIKKAQEQFSDAKRAPSSQEQLFGYLSSVGEDEEYYFPTTALLVARSPRSSSRSSLIQSRSGSVDISDPLLPSVLVPTPQPHLPVSPTRKCHNRTVSIELSDFRQSSISSDEGPYTDVGRTTTTAEGVEIRIGGGSTRSGGSKSTTSPRPERRAFLLRGSGGSFSSPNTLSVAGARVYSEPCKDTDDLGCTVVPSIQVPSPSKSVSPSRSPLLSPRLLQRSMSGCSSKHPLLKTRQCSQVAIHSAPTSKGPSPIHSFDSDSISVDVTTGLSHSDMDVTTGRARHQRPGYREPSPLGFERPVSPAAPSYECYTLAPPGGLITDSRATDSSRSTDSRAKGDPSVTTARLHLDGPIRVTVNGRERTCPYDVERLLNDPTIQEYEV